MTHADFLAEGYYFDGGQQLLQINTLLKHAEGGTEVCYKVGWDQADDKVVLEQASTGAIIELEANDATRQLLHDCYPATEQDAGGHQFRY